MPTSERRMMVPVSTDMHAVAVSAAAAGGLTLRGWVEQSIARSAALEGALRAVSERQERSVFTRFEEEGR